METEKTTEIFRHLKKMAETIVKNDRTELARMKAELDEYTENVSSQMPQSIMATMHQEVEKCRRCAGQWLLVYLDDKLHPAVKEDILKEEVMEFFFSMNEKVVAVQKNFFLLAMVDQQLSGATTLTEQQRAAMIAKSRILGLAKEQGLTPNVKTVSDEASENSESQRLWFFGDERNLLQSNEEGLTDVQALDYLLK